MDKYAKGMSILEGKFGNYTVKGEDI